MTRLVSDIMTTAVITAQPEETAAAIALRLAKHGISAVPVCDPEHHVLGVISEGDLMRPFSQANHLRRDWWLGLLAEGGELAPVFLDYIREDKRIAGDLMTRPAYVATEDMTIPQVADMMISHGVKRLPVVRGGKLVGVVSRADLVRALYDQKQPSAAGVASPMAATGP